MDKKSFNEVSFLQSVREVEINLPNVKNDTNGKQLVRSSIVNAMMDKDEVFSYILNLLETLKPVTINCEFDVKGWKEIYNYFIQHPDYPKFGATLKEKLATLSTPLMYQMCFTEWAVAYGHNPETLLNEIKLDCIGWWKVYVFLVKRADELGIVVEKPVSDEDLWKEEVKKAKEDAKAEKAKTKESKKEDSKEKDVKPTSPRRGRPRKSDSKKSKEVVKAVETVEPATPVSETPMVKTTLPTKDVKEDMGAKKLSAAPHKRGYDIPVLQYKKGEIFPDVETASKKTGVAIEEILKSFETRPTTKVDCIWKYTNKKKKEVVQFTYLHTYKNQSDIDKSSKEVCGKSLNHSNVSPKLKQEWSSVTKGDFVWVQIPGIDLADDLKKEESYKICEDTCVPEISIPTPVKDHLESSYPIVDGEKVSCVKLNPYSTNTIERYPVIKRISEDNDKCVMPLEECKIESAA